MIIRDRILLKREGMMMISPTLGTIMPNDPLKVSIWPITRAWVNKLKEALNGLIQNIWSRMDI
jgi:hypothetical protein